MQTMKLIKRSYCSIHGDLTCYFEFLLYHIENMHSYSFFIPPHLCHSAGLLLWQAVRPSPISPSSGSRPSGTPLWGRSRPFTIRTPTSTHTWTTSAPCTAAPPSLCSQQPGASALQMVSQVKHTPIHETCI